MKMAHQNGADFVDLNCGCPIYEATRRGLGSSLLRSPDKLQKLVAGLVKGSEGNIPVTVKIRLGCESDTVNCLEHVTKLREAGAAAVTIHGRTAQQGYSRNADWTLIDKAVQENNSMPIIGNGDILTHYEARRRMMETGVDSVMVGRGALEKPWIFQEFNDGATWTPDIQTRVEVYRTLAVYMKEHFGDDDMGRKKSWTFLPWHFDFLSRYVPYPESEYGARSIERPLLQSRFGESTDGMTPLEILMANRCSDAHDIVASILWESDSNMDAVHKLTAFAESHDFNEIVMNGSAVNSDEDEELTNLKAKGVPGIRGKRQGRKPGPKRSDEEIAQIRAQRAAKKAGILADGGIWPP
uniref:tRNA-dihydrouridine(47) synthase [NAD(P)(+)] n=1 Tax=Proboscia inermis TaxID=420281 RepID=A0A7S0C769_9STRA|mmetsp:Transcript_29903/g.30224  ORF Transcript_29903/g.30224 Transcript_29903/m.30224 type:complete len:354 (+) Transcript_29903:2-1063(+)